MAARTVLVSKDAGEEMKTPIIYFLGLWFLWMLQFVLFGNKQKRKPIKIARGYRIGMLVQMLGCWAIFVPASTHWTTPIPLWRIVTGSAVGLVGICLATSGIRHLGKQWQMRAAINDDHELITSGPYQIVRHPIYASMLAMLVMSALLLGRLPWWPMGIALFLVGIEIRIHAEERLLRDCFGPSFEAWKAKVPAYLPLIR
jgi:protein-S-isoprenylcysteine O-methyltransferase Ste14